MIGYPFIYNGIASELFGISIVYINNNSIKTPSGSGIEFQTDTIFRNPEVLFMGAKQSPVLEFPIEFISEKAMDIQKYHEIKDWLFGNIDGFKPLQICLDGYKQYYWNCKLVSNEDYSYSDGYRGFSCKCICDAPWAWQFPTYKQYSFTETYTNKIEIYNISADKEDIKPIVEFTLTPNNYNFSITNTSYNNLTFEFTNLLSEETIKVDNKSGIIKSSSGLRRLKNLSKGKNQGFLKLKKGMNVLVCNGMVSDLKITYQNAIRLGGGFNG